MAFGNCVSFHLFDAALPQLLFGERGCESSLQMLLFAAISSPAHSAVFLATLFRVGALRQKRVSSSQGWQQACKFTHSM